MSAASRARSARPGGWLRRAAGRAWLGALGWELVGGPPPVDKAVVVAYPHTSNWDLPFSIACAYALGVDVQWVGKRSLFRAPFGGLMKRMGGIPVDRTKRTNFVDATVESLRGMERALVLFPPEGTRAKAGRWKSGFYWVAVGAEIPIILGVLDFGRKRVGLGEVLYPSGDIEADFERIRAFYAGVRGLRPEKQGEITLVP